jgi:hypothetical protein
MALRLSAGEGLTFQNLLAYDPHQQVIGWTRLPTHPPSTNHQGQN